jgi:hypothetical protein
LRKSKEYWVFCVTDKELFVLSKEKATMDPRIDCILGAVQGDSAVTSVLQRAVLSGLQRLVVLE